MLEGSLRLPEPQSWVGVAAGSVAVAACLGCWQPELRTGLHPAERLQPGAWDTGERPTALAGPAQDILRRVSEGAVSAMDPPEAGNEARLLGLCRKAKLRKPLLELKEGRSRCSW